MESIYEVKDPTGLLSPCLLFYPEVIRNNLLAAISIAGDPSRLRPHVKTHKTPEIVQLEAELGITKHKCATLAEANMLAECGAGDVLVAYPQVGPAVKRLADILESFPATHFAAVADNPQNVRELSEVFASRELAADVLIDLDVGMHRTGIAPGPAAVELARMITELPGLRLAGLHVYDGQNHQPSLDERKQAVRTLMEPVEQFMVQLKQAGIAVPKLVCGGTPTFPVFAELDTPSDIAIELSPGTCVLNDFNYHRDYREMDAIIYAALLLTRVISKPMEDLLTLDLGYKAVASDPPADRRCHFLDLPDAKLVQHSEEHLVIQTPRAADYSVGDVLYAVPAHICPTVALHAYARVIESGEVRATWNVTARDRLR